MSNEEIVRLVDTAFIDRYDCSSSYQALTGYAEWIQLDQLIDHPAVQNCMKIMKN
ncbi:hypothetical protein [Sporosarcina sp. P16b]|uniref:hypothetical protein n=1 Tax=Sporosarcina sp. P16b TaxID=2048261 RepID=UPI0013045C92|nr:hypothetical protein [Sporosarcina sp. P16b]